MNGSPPIAPVLPNTPFSYSDKAPTFVNSNIITLGLVLFYDKAISLNNKVSCGSCHLQSAGFADNLKFSKGALENDLSRNTLSISGVSNNLFWDGRVNRMDDLVLLPISNHKEMLQNLNDLPKKLSLISYYQTLFRKAFLTEEITLEQIGFALSAFCKLMVANNSKFDMARSINHPDFFKPDSLPLFSAEENLGYRIFTGKGNCSSCHSLNSGFTYNSTFANIGLDIEYKDKGLAEITGDVNDIGKFKTPNLKNIALTAPYMHDGRFETLEQVIEHYNSNVKPHSNLSFSLVDLEQYEQTMTKVPLKLNLTPAEKKALVVFLKTLTDEKLRNDVRFSDPFFLK